MKPSGRMSRSSGSISTASTRAADGHTLVASYHTNRVFELDRNGKVVWEHKDALHPFRARRR